jgi:hypothetical protein
MKYSVSVGGGQPENQGMNFNIQVEAANILDALDKAKPEFAKVVAAAGLIPGPASPIVPPVIALPSTPVS